MDTTPCIVPDGLVDQAMVQSRGLWARLSKRVMLAVAVTALSYIFLELAAVFLGEEAPLTAAARALFSLFLALTAVTYWSNTNAAVLRMVIQRPRCAPVS